MSITVELLNDFHDTSVRVRGAVKRRTFAGEQIGYISLSQRQAKRVRAKLCGAKGCTCGVVRGPQPSDIEVDFPR
jgi:hypothetical protein